MKFRRTAGVLVLVLAVPLVVVQSSSASTTQTRVHVHMTRSAKFAPNSSVQIMAWPNSTVLSQLKPGDKVPVVTVASSVTDARGDSSLVMDTASLPSTYSDALGQLSLEVRVQDGAYLADYTMPSLRDSTQSLVIDPDRAKVVVTTQKFVHSGMTRAGANSQTAAAPPAKIAILTAPKARSTSRIAPAAGIACSTTYVGTDSTLTKVPEYFTTVWTANNILATISESVGSTHTIDQGVSASGATGTWTVSGTFSISTANAQKESRQIYQPTHYGNTINMGKYLTQCGPSKTYYLKSIGFAAYINQYYVNTIRGVVVGQRYYSGASGYCLGAQNPGTTSTQMSTSRTMGAGLSVADLSLNTSTNWTRDVDITWSPQVKWDKCYNSIYGASRATDSEVHAA